MNGTNVERKKEKLIRKKFKKLHDQIIKTHKKEN